MREEKDFRTEFKEYLYNKVQAGKLSKIDADTQYSDADYPRKHAEELGLDYFEMFKNDENFEQALDIIKLNFEQNGKNKTTFSAYKKALQSFRDFYMKNTTKNSSTTVWFIRSNNGEFLQDFLGKKVVAVGWLQESYEGKSREEIKNCLMKGFPGNKLKTIAQWAGCCWRFANEIQINDYVITNNHDGTVYIGKITGNYKYSPDYYKKNPHIRSVNWIKKIKRNSLPQKIQSYLKPNLTVTSFEDSNNDIEKICNSIKEQDMPNIPLNQILYGPPGTGKTYNTIVKAMEIINGEKYDSVDDKKYKELKGKFDGLKQQGQIEFVTFHQSYSYEEFVEGIKPDLESNDIKYKLGNGIFKKICNIATRELYSSNIDKIVNFDTIYKMFQEKYEPGSSCSNLLNIKYEPNNLIYHFGVQSQDRRIDLNKIKEIFNSNKQYSTASEFNKDYQGNPALKCYFFNFYQELIKIKNDYIDENKIDNNINNNAKNYILIIDEINRGNISKIFGELITLIEEDKRGTLSVRLPYSQDDFTVPKNLYIIGTMNTSDRSIASIDIALRRRFKFVEMMPRPEKIVNKNHQPQMVEDINLQSLLKTINERISYLLDRDHQIGHSYFMNWKNYDMATLKDVWFDEIIPLLNEYFYSDWDKLQAILGGKNDNDKNDKKFFITKLKKPDLAYNIDCSDEEFYYNFVKKEDVNETDFRTMLENAKLIEPKPNETSNAN